MFSLKTFYALAFACFFIGAQAKSINDPSHGSKFIKYDFKVQKGNSTGVPKIDKRSGPIPAKLANGGDIYLIDVFIGSNKQKNTVVLDTGSSDLWVFDTSDPETSDPQYTLGSYDPSSSSTSKYVSSDFAVFYGFDGHVNAHGKWYTDDVALSPAGGPIVNIQLGDATRSVGISNAILGVGLTALEAPDQTYPNYPLALANAGYISRDAYSLYLNSIEATSGSIIFGGIDHAKYSGDLVTFPVNGGNRLNIQADSATFNNKQYNLGVSVNLDSGTTIAYLPSDFVSSLASDILGPDAKVAHDSGLFTVSGSCPNIGDLSYNFGGLAISIPPDDLLASNGSECELLIGQSDGPYLLGDVFLRHAYVFYDLSRNNIALAQVKYTSESNIQPI